MGWLQKIRTALGVDPVASFRKKTRKTRGLTLRRTICTFCSCGCGMNAWVKDGHLVALEGDPEHPINEGTLCSKGAAAAGLHTSADRVLRPRRRRPGASQFVEVSWDEALAAITERLASLLRGTWNAAARRSDAIGLLGGAINTNEEAYAWRKLAALLGLPHVEHQARV